MALFIYLFRVGSTPSMEANAGLELTTLRSKPEPRSRVGCLTNLSHPGSPEWLKFLKHIIACTNKDAGRNVKWLWKTI